MILPLLLLALQAGPAEPADVRYQRCAATAKSDAAAGERDARAWLKAGGGAGAGQCLGVALVNQSRFADAAGAFEAAAREAAKARKDSSGVLWAQAGNAWLAAGQAERARTAFTTALDAGLDGLDAAEAHLDRARASVAAGDFPTARSDLDAALAGAPDDALAWLLSASLARRMNDLPRAQADIAEAEKRVGDESQVMLEAGNIAAAAGDEAGARSAWTKAAAGSNGDVSRQANTALAQFAAAPSHP